MHSNLLLRKPTDSKLYVEDVFSTYLYNGTSVNQTIVNGIDLAGKGGMVWIKARTGTTAPYNYNTIYDTARGIKRYLRTEDAAADSGINNNSLAAFNSNGFDTGTTISNYTGQSFASWTFRKAPKFFDVVTYTGDGTNNRTISHSLGAVPGMIIVKSTSATGSWYVYHRALPTAQDEYLVLNSTAASVTTGGVAFGAPTSTTFMLEASGGNGRTNATGVTYVAYLFAHDTTADGVIQCGSFTTDASGNVGTINLGWEPQYILCKASSATQGWYVFDTMRGWTASGNTFGVQPNASSAELDYSGGTKYLIPTATGFNGTGNFFGTNTTVIYLAIRRGPMRVPTDATKVFAPQTYTGTGTGSRVISGIGFPPDAIFQRDRAGGLNSLANRLVGGSRYLLPYDTTFETVRTAYGVQVFGQDGYTQGSSDQNSANLSGANFIDNHFRRAPGFFDVVCYTGTGVARTINHNLGVVPELMIVKCRDGADSWYVYSSSLPSASYYVRLNTTGAQATSSGLWNNTAPTSSVFSIGTGLSGSGNTYVAYLFASCPGVSKVGSYTGTGTTLQINCGFTNGARFVLIKRTDSIGDWTVWDTARGIVSGNDPYLLLNSTVAEVTNTDYIDPLSTGFEISSTAPAAINANGGTFVFLAIA